MSVGWNEMTVPTHMEKTLSRFRKGRKMRRPIGLLLGVLYGIAAGPMVYMCVRFGGELDDLEYLDMPAGDVLGCSFFAACMLLGTTLAVCTSIGFLLLGALPDDRGALLEHLLEREQRADMPQEDHEESQQTGAG